MLDSFDVKILDIWQNRGDVGPIEMAAHVNLSPSQCSRRMQRLRKEGYVRAENLRSVVDYRLLAASHNGRWQIVALLAGD